MKDSSYKRFKNDDFVDALPVKAIPALVKLQAEQAKTRITIRLDNATLAAFRTHAQKKGSSYQALINEALKEYLRGQNLAKVVRETIRKELRAA